MQGCLCTKRLTERHFLGDTFKGVSNCSVILGRKHEDSLDSGYKFTGWDNGYPDLVVKPELSSMR